MESYADREDTKVQNGCVVLFICLSIFLAGCAFDLVHVKQTPSEIDLAEHKKSSWILVDDVELKLGTGYRRQLKSGTRWDYVGKIEHGDIFKTKDQVLTIEGSNIFEAYIVVSEGKLIGFYLPVEKTYSPLPSAKDLTMDIIGSSE